MLWNLSTKWIGAIKTSIYIYVSPVITVILSVLILHEKITVISIIGTVLILIGLVISQKTRTTDQITFPKEKMKLTLSE
ncbi:MAG: EamA family transporter [Anaerobutyricum sp.]